MQFDSNLSMVNAIVLGNLWVVALKSYPFPHFRLHYDFSPTLTTPQLLFSFSLLGKLSDRDFHKIS